MKILCVCPNPSVDMTMIVPDFKLGHVFRCVSEADTAGGKAINCARALRTLGANCLLVSLVGGHSGRRVVELTEAEGQTAKWVWASKQTRSCVHVLEPNYSNGVARTTTVNSCGFTTDADWSKFQESVLECMSCDTDISVVCLSGSVPDGIGPSSYAALINSLHSRECFVWIDTSDRWLSAAIAAKPDGVKINAQEAESVTGLGITDARSAAVAAKRLLEMGVRLAAVITLGGDGAVLVMSDRAWLAVPPAVAVVSTVGSGDSSLAALVLRLHSRPIGELTEDLIRCAIAECVAAGSANALTSTPASFSLSDFQSILSRTKVDAIS